MRRTRRGSIVAAIAIMASGCSAADIASSLDRALDETPATTSSPAPLPSEPTAPPDAAGAIPTEGAVVTRVVDGDTVQVRLASGAIEKVRFIGINTPESTTRHEPYGKEASAFTTSRLDGATIRLEYDVERRDRYGRLLAYLWMRPPVIGSPAEVRAAMFNATLLIEGYAQVATYPPNVRYVDVFRGLQREAREANRGLWGLPAPRAGGGSTPPPSARGGCDASYPDVCIPPPPPDLDCRDISYRNFRVLPPDPHRFDGDKDGFGCAT